MHEYTCKCAHSELQITTTHVLLYFAVLETLGISTKGCCRVELLGFVKSIFAVFPDLSDVYATLDLRILVWFNLF